MKMHKLFTDESTWTQDAFARDNQGNSVNPNSKKAVCWCLMGALKKCYKLANGRQLAVWSKLEGVIRGVAVYNDVKGRTFEDIKELVTKLNI